jgi:hypothetical protein
MPLQEFVLDDGVVGAEVTVSTKDQAARDECAVALEAARQRGLAGAPAGS